MACWRRAAFLPVRVLGRNVALRQVCAPKYGLAHWTYEQPRTPICLHMELDTHAWALATRHSAGASAVCGPSFGVERDDVSAIKCGHPHNALAVTHHPTIGHVKPCARLPAVDDDVASRGSLRTRARAEGSATVVAVGVVPPERVECARAISTAFTLTRTPGQRPGARPIRVVGEREGIGPLTQTASYLVMMVFILMC